MRILLLIFLGTFSIYASAGEVIDFSAQLNFQHCQTNSNGKLCKIHWSGGFPFQIELKPVYGSTSTVGFYLIRGEIDGLEFKVGVHMLKTKTDHYNLEIWDYSRNSIELIGDVTVSSIGDLNEIAFRGDKVEIGNISTSPWIKIGSKNAIFSSKPEGTH